MGIVFGLIAPIMVENFEGSGPGRIPLGGVLGMAAAISFIVGGIIASFLYIIFEEGIVDLVASLAEPVILSAALLRIACEPIDSGSLLVYGLVIGVYHDDDRLMATIELPEALQ